MDVLGLLLFNDENIEEIVVVRALEKSLRERKQLYTPLKFDMHAIPNENFLYMFRSDKQDIIKLHSALQLPHRFETEDQHVIDGLTGVCMLLRRFAYPNRLKELQNEFGLHFSSISKLLTVVTDLVYTKWARLLTYIGHNKWFTDEYQKKLAIVVQDKGAPLTNCIGFIDGTARSICRPTVLQKELYSGHKRSHCLKFQSITLPNGIILHLSPPYPGRRHDAFMLRDTLILDQLRKFAKSYCVYGDEGYPLKVQLIRPYSSSTLTEQQQEFNNKMSKLRQCVEWSFGKIVQQFAYVDFKKNQKLLLQPLGKFYFVATILTNAHTCLYGSTTSSYFNMESPDLTEYFKVKS